MNVMIVDDEPLAIELLEMYIAKLPQLHLVSRCSNALEAFSVLNKQQVDLIFLDINMPEVSGMDFLKMLRNPPRIIFTTAYSEYAAESYDHNVVDYLLKPVTFERFMKAVQKLSEHAVIAQKDDVLFVRSESKMIKVDLPQLYYIEGYKNYVRLCINGTKIIVRNTMKNFEEYLEQHPSFQRVHKSYIVNLDHISEISGNTLKIANEYITIGTTFRDSLQASINKYKQL